MHSFEIPCSFNKPVRTMEMDMERSTRAHERRVEDTVETSTLDRLQGGILVVLTVEMAYSLAFSAVDEA